MPSIGIYSWALHPVRCGEHHPGRLRRSHCGRIWSWAAWWPARAPAPIPISPTSMSWADHCPICEFDLLMAAVAGRQGAGRQDAGGQPLFLRHLLRRRRPGTCAWRKWASWRWRWRRRPCTATPPTPGKRALAICSISDNLVTGEELSSADRQTTFTNMMKIALEAAVKMA